MGACSCSCRKDEPSKHWLCVHVRVRQGTSIRSVERGHFNDMTLDVATISESSALSLTGNYQKDNFSHRIWGSLLSRTTCSFVIVFLAN